MKKSVQSSLVAAALLLSFTSLSVNAQSVSQDSLHNARTQSFSGTVTYDGSGAGTGGANGSYFGYNAGHVTTGDRNSFFGAEAGSANTTGVSNNYFGYRAGYSSTTSTGNAYFGTNTGYATTTGGTNSLFGNLSGYSLTTGENNTFVGSYAGYSHSTGTRNVFIGAHAGSPNTSGNYNTILGNRAGFLNVSGTGNVFLGYYAGGQELGSNKLYIANSNTTTPLIFGDFDASQLVLNGKVGVSTSTFPTTVGTADVSNYKLFVKGGILTEEVRVRTGWADYVFQPQYQLKSLASVEKFIKENGHLPNVPSAKTVESEGLSLGEIAKIQQEKIEELTLYLIEQSKKIELLQRQTDDLKAAMKGLEKK